MLEFAVFCLIRTGFEQIQLSFLDDRCICSELLNCCNEAAPLEESDVMGQ